MSGGVETAGGAAFQPLDAAGAALEPWRADGRNDGEDRWDSEANSGQTLSRNYTRTTPASTRAEGF